jgi:O-antigen/teichoic acid export membrane protein
MSQTTVKAGVGTITTGRGLSLRRNFSWAFAGNTISAACQWAVLMVFAKLGTPELVGQFALGLALVSPVFMFSSLNLRGVQATDARNDFQFQEYLGLRIGAGFFAFIVSAAISAIAGYGLTIFLVTTAIGFQKMIESAGDALYGFFQKHERMNFIAKSMIMKSILSLFTVALIMTSTMNLNASILSIGITSFAIMLFYDMTMFRKIHPHKLGNWLKDLQVLRLRRLAIMSAPLGLVMMINSLNTNVPRYYLEHYFSNYDLGIFAALAYIMTAGTTVIAALGQSASPRLAKHFAARQFMEFRRLLYWLVTIAAILGLAGFIVAEYLGAPLLALVYTEEYAVHAPEFAWIMLAAGFSYISSVMGYAITAARRFRVQVPITVVSLIVATLASFLLVPEHGIQGAVWTILVVFASQIPLKSLVILHSLRTA